MKVSIAAMRVHRNLTQKDVAKSMNIDPSTLRNWESGKTAPNYDQMQQLCSIYECQLSDIILTKKSA